MPTFIGFSTQHSDSVRTPQINTGADGGSGTLNKPLRFNKKYRTLDEELVFQDFINALNIPQGQKPGKPEYGTTLWSFIFEPNTLDVQIALETEIRRVASYDPRLVLNSVTCYPQDNGILLEVEVAVNPFNNPTILAILFDQSSSTASRSN
jgi:phage baseplate assembly protein W